MLNGAVFVWYKEVLKQDLTRLPSKAKSPETIEDDTRSGEIHCVNISCRNVFKTDWADHADIFIFRKTNDFQLPSPNGVWSYLVRWLRG